MAVAFEFKAKGKPQQYTAIDQAIRTGQFIRNKCLRLWLDVKGTNKMDFYKYCKVLAHEFSFANKLNSTARQAMSVREACAWGAYEHGHLSLDSTKTVEILSPAKSGATPVRFPTPNGDAPRTPSAKSVGQVSRLEGTKPLCGRLRQRKRGNAHQER